MKRSRKTIWTSLNARFGGRNNMGEEWWGVLGVTISYIASFMGLMLAWVTYKKRQKQNSEQKNGESS